MPLPSPVLTLSLMPVPTGTPTPVPISDAFANRYTVAVALPTCSYLNIDSAPPAASHAVTDFCPLAETKATAYTGADACADAAAVARADAVTDARDNPTAAIAINGSADALAQRRRRCQSQL
jgi:hypothetical protein